MLPPAKPLSLLLTAPPRSPTNPYHHSATSPPPPQTPPPPCVIPAAVCLREPLCARGKTHSCAASSNVYIVTPTPTHTQTHANARTHSYCNICCFQYYYPLPQREFVLLCPVLDPPGTEYLSPLRQLVLVCPYCDYNRFTNIRHIHQYTSPNFRD